MPPEHNCKPAIATWASGKPLYHDEEAAEFEKQVPPSEEL